jgi:hypothetical protein
LALIKGTKGALEAWEKIGQGLKNEIAWLEENLKQERPSERLKAYQRRSKSL